MFDRSGHMNSYMYELTTLLQIFLNILFVIFVKVLLLLLCTNWRGLTEEDQNISPCGISDLKMIDYN